MLVAPHFLVGVAIATYVPEAGPAVLVTLASHFVLDSIPHRDTIGGFHVSKINIIMESFDALVALGIFFLLVPVRSWLYVFTIGATGMLPDVIEIVGLFFPRWYTLPIIKGFHLWHTQEIQPERRGMNWFWGLLPQFLAIGVAVYFLTMKPL
ncbi:hypothetical protein KJ836_00700 [Patescibacteria group bacterium]|nr:hypothetical protein [Patescibacteria group bacterium]